MQENPPIHCAKGTPPAAEAKIKNYYSLPDLSPELSSLLERLAKHPSMKKVWKTLPETPDAGVIIDLVFVAYGTARDLRPRMPKGKLGQEEYFRRYAVEMSKMELGPLAAITRLLRESTEETILPCTRARWKELWSDDPHITFDK